MEISPNEGRALIPVLFSSLKVYTERYVDKKLNGEEIMQATSLRKLLLCLVREFGHQFTNDEAISVGLVELVPVEYRLAVRYHRTDSWLLTKIVRQFDDTRPFPEINANFVALDGSCKPVAHGNDREEATMRARAAGCYAPMIARND